MLLIFSSLKNAYDAQCFGHADKRKKPLNPPVRSHTISTVTVN